jgi:hypothetical protein
MPPSLSSSDGIDDSIEKALGDIPHIEKEIKNQKRQKQDAVYGAIEKTGSPYLIKGGEITEGVIGPDEDQEEDSREYLHFSQEKKD